MTENIDFEQFEFLNSDCATKKHSSELLDSALHYASIGYPVFPLHNALAIKGEIACSCTQRLECPNIAKHPRTRHGFLDATIDAERIINWWKQYPKANIGLLTGKESGIFVLDVDVKTGGKYSLDDLIDYYGVFAKKEPFPATLTAITGSGGCHYYFKYLLDFGVKSTAGAIGNGLDIRGDGAYIVAPPSVHPSGKKYIWFGANIPILDAPDWLIYEILKADEKENNVMVTEPTIVVGKPVEKVFEGNRHNDLFRHISGLVNSYPEEEVLRKALERNATVLVPPFPEKQVEKQVDYLFKRYRRSPNKNMGLKS